MKTHHLPSLFPVPKDYRREFQFEAGAGTRTGVFKYQIIIDRLGIHLAESGNATAITNSQCLDWLAESIYAVREELGV